MSVSVSISVWLHQPGPETADGLGSEVLGSERLHLMAALLRAIEESNGQTSTSVESSQSQDDTLDVQSSHSDRPAPHPLPHPRAAKPPVARARLAIMEMTEQHELSAIQEVETPANASLITGQPATPTGGTIHHTAGVNSSNHLYTSFINKRVSLTSYCVLCPQVQK